MPSLLSCTSSVPSYTTTPRFAGSGQSPQRSAPVGHRIARPQPASPRNCTEKVLGYLGYGLRKAVACADYLIPTAIKKPIVDRINLWLSTFKHDPNAPETKLFANHELGHALVALGTGLPMEGLYLVNMRQSGGGVVFPNTVQAVTTPDQFHRLLLTLMGGQAAELNQATPQQLGDPNFLTQVRLHALSDIAKGIELVRYGQKQGWLGLRPDEVPAEINLAQYVSIIQKPRTQRTQDEQALQGIYALQVRDFMRLPIVQDALRTAQQIHAAVPAENQEQMADAVAHCDLRLNQTQLYDLLEQNLNDPTLQRMQDRLDSFLRRHN